MDCNIRMTIIPAYRISRNTIPEVRISSADAAKVEVTVLKEKQVLLQTAHALNRCKEEQKLFLDMKDITGRILINFELFNDVGNLIYDEVLEYEIIDSGCQSTTLIDGCWISVYHWSESEARWFNEDLKKLTDEDWKKKIYYMNEVGIKGVILQNVFHCDEYAGKHDMTVENYNGLALYPSKLFKDRYPIAANDPVEAILSAADECGMNVFLGVGLFAWFDFSPQALEWHLEVTKELFEMYGKHKSLYGWYISAEIFGALYYDYPHVEGKKYTDIVDFFRDYKKFVSILTPTKPVALAPNNIRFHEFAKEWKEILENVDILIPFAFARDPENLNMKEIQDICDSCGTHFWIDMEMFSWPLDNGLVPKTTDELIKEIRFYDGQEQIYGYQFTGLMNAPDDAYNLGGSLSKDLFKGYKSYYKNITG